MPLTPDCTATTLTGARQSGWVEVAVGVGLEDSVVEGVAVPVRDCELPGVPVRVAVVGDGPARAEFGKLLPSSTRFFGALTGAALATAYASSDIFLNPSTSEGWGATCLEAQAAGLPVVATASSGIVDVVAEGVGGRLLPPDNVSAMAEAVAALVADTATRREMGRRAAEHAARFDWESSGSHKLIGGMVTSTNGLLQVRADCVCTLLACEGAAACCALTV